MSANAFQQESFAEFVAGARESEAQWYSMKPLHNDVPSLVNLLEVSAENLLGLFVKAGLGKLGHANKFFSFHASKFESLSSLSMIQDECQASHPKVKGMKTKQWFMRLGTHYIGDLCPPSTKGCPPWVQKIQSKQQNFQYAISKKLPLQPWQHIQAQVEETKKSDTEEGPNDHYKNGLVLLQVQPMLLPLLMKEELQENLEGIGNLGEDFEKWNHQDEAKADRRLECVRNFAIRESIKSKEEVQVKDQKVQAKIIRSKRSRKKAPWM
jgi:hypothetical protein